MKKARKAPAKVKASFDQETPGDLNSPLRKFAITMHDPETGAFVLALRYDGTLETGPAFTTTDKAARMFWAGVVKYAKISGLLAEVEKHHGAHVAGI